MDIDPKKLLDRAIRAPRALKVIAAIAAIDLLVLLLAAFVLEDQVDDRGAQIEQLRSQLTVQRKKVETTRKQIDSLPELRKLYDNAMSEGSLADQDRLKFVDLVQTLGNRDYLIGLHYRLQPEVLTPIAGTKMMLVSTEVNITNGALLDDDIFKYWSQFLTQSQAHYQITKFRVDRLQMDTQTALARIRAGDLPPLVHAELTFNWLSMRHQPAPAAANQNSAAARPAAGSTNRAAK